MDSPWGCDRVPRGASRAIGLVFGVSASARRERRETRMDQIVDDAAHERMDGSESGSRRYHSAVSTLLREIA